MIDRLIDFSIKNRLFMVLAGAPTPITVTIPVYLKP